MALEKVLALGASGVIEKEIDTGGAVVSPITKANFLAKFQTWDVVHALSPAYFDPAVGVGYCQNMAYGVGASITYRLSNFESGGAITGTGGTGSAYALTSVATGTTTTGYASRNSQIPIYNVGVLGRQHKYLYNTEVPPASNPNRKLIATATAYVSAVSDATDTYTASVTLAGSGPSSNIPIAATHTGVHLTYAHTENSGNWVIKYRNTSGVLTSINTSIPVGLVSTPTYMVLTHDRATGAMNVQLSVGLGAPTTYNIPDYDDSATYALYPGNRFRIAKSLGTVSRTLNVVDMAVGFTFA